MASPTVVYERIYRVTPEEFNLGFNTIRDTIDVERAYYDSTSQSLAETKSKLFALFVKYLCTGVGYRILYEGRLAVVTAGRVEGKYFRAIPGFVMPDENGSQAYHYDDAFLEPAQYGMKEFLPTIGCVGIKGRCNINRAMYSHRIALAAKPYAQHTLVTTPVGEEGDLTFTQTYIQE